jgi:hypothetical protein
MIKARWVILVVGSSASTMRSVGLNTSVYSGACLTMIQRFDRSCAATAGRVRPWGVFEPHRANRGDSPLGTAVCPVGFSAPIT